MGTVPVPEPAGLLAAEAEAWLIGHRFQERFQAFLDAELEAMAAHYPGDADRCVLCPVAAFLRDVADGLEGLEVRHDNRR